MVGVILPEANLLLSPDQQPLVKLLTHLPLFLAIHLFPDPPLLVVSPLAFLPELLVALVPLAFPPEPVVDQVPPVSPPELVVALVALVVLGFPLLELVVPPLVALVFPPELLVVALEALEALVALVFPPNFLLVVALVAPGALVFPETPLLAHLPLDPLLLVVVFLLELLALLVDLADLPQEPLLLVVLQVAFLPHPSGLLMVPVVLASPLELLVLLVALVLYLPPPLDRLMALPLSESNAKPLNHPYTTLAPRLPLSLPNNLLAQQPLRPSLLPPASLLPPRSRVPSHLLSLRSLPLFPLQDSPPEEVLVLVLVLLIPPVSPLEFQVQQAQKLVLSLLLFLLALLLLSPAHLLILRFPRKGEKR